MKQKIYFQQLSSENKNYDYVNTNLIEFFLTDIFNKLDYNHEKIKI